MAQARTSAEQPPQPAAAGALDRGDSEKRPRRFVASAALVRLRRTQPPIQASLPALPGRFRGRARRAALALSVASTVAPALHRRANNPRAIPIACLRRTPRHSHPQRAATRRPDGRMFHDLPPAPCASCRHRLGPSRRPPRPSASTASSSSATAMPTTIMRVADPREARDPPRPAQIHNPTGAFRAAPITSTRCRNCSALRSNFAIGGACDFGTGNLFNRLRRFGLSPRASPASLRSDVPPRRRRHRRVPDRQPDFDERPLAVSIGGNDARAYSIRPLYSGRRPRGRHRRRGQRRDRPQPSGRGRRAQHQLPRRQYRQPARGRDRSDRAGAAHDLFDHFNNAIQTTLAGYAANGVIVNYTDLTLCGTTSSPTPPLRPDQRRRVQPGATCISDPAASTQASFSMSTTSI